MQAYNKSLAAICYHLLHFGDPAAGGNSTVAFGALPAKLRGLKSQIPNFEVSNLNLEV